AARRRPHGNSYQPQHGRRGGAGRPGGNSEERGEGGRARGGGAGCRRPCAHGNDGPRVAARHEVHFGGAVSPRGVPHVDALALNRRAWAGAAAPAFAGGSVWHGVCLKLARQATFKGTQCPPKPPVSICSRSTPCPCAPFTCRGWRFSSASSRGSPARR